MNTEIMKRVAERTPSVETFRWGLRREYLDNGRVALLTAHGEASDAAIDEWTEVLQATVNTFVRRRQPVFIVADTSDASRSFSIDDRERVTRVCATIPATVPAHIAILDPRQGLSKLIGDFAGRFHRSHAGGVHIRLFTDRVTAFDWIQQRLDDSRYGLAIGRFGSAN